MNKLDISSYQPRPNDKFFLDNNIWMYLYCPMGGYNPHTVEVYSEFLGKILDSGAKVYVCSQVLSEFYNSYLRLDFNLWKKDQPNPRNIDFKKDFRSTKQCQETSQTISLTIEGQILELGIRVDDSFSSIEMEKIFYSLTFLDYNDSYFAELCIKNNFILVSNDRDFINVTAPLKLATSN